MGIQTITVETAEGIDTGDIRALSREDFVRFIQPEIRAFETDFVALGQSPLLVIETTMLRTYLAWKLRGLKKEGS